MRLKLQSKVLRATWNTAPKEYLNLRHWWLHYLRQLRARRKITGANVRKEMKTAQRELARLRKEYL